MLLTNMIQIISAGNNVIVSIFYQALGGSLVSIPIWILLGGFMLFPIIHAAVNLIQPDNNLNFSRWNKATFGLLIGIILKIIFGLRF